MKFDFPVWEAVFFTGQPGFGLCARTAPWGAMFPDQPHTCASVRAVRLPTLFGSRPDVAVPPHPVYSQRRPAGCLRGKVQRSIRVCLRICASHGGCLETKTMHPSRPSSGRREGLCDALNRPAVAIALAGKSKRRVHDVVALIN